MAEIVEEYFNTRDAARLSGLNLQMLNYLCRQEILVPSLPMSKGRGRARKYSFGDVVMLRVIAALLEKGVSVMRLKAGLKTLRKYHPEITSSSLPAAYLVTDGEKVFFRRSEQSLETLDSGGQLSFAFILELGRLRDAVVEIAAVSAVGKGGK